jgi:hypothetical protein
MLADKGYVGANHCYYAYKSNEVAGREMSKEDRDFIDKQISLVRTRVEQFFSRLRVWKITVHNFRALKFFSKALHFILYIEHLKALSRPGPRYEVLPAPPGIQPFAFQDLDLGARCDCEFQPKISGSATVRTAAGFWTRSNRAVVTSRLRALRTYLPTAGEKSQNRKR